MAEIKSTRVRRIRHRGRGSQVLIYLGKQLRFFINQNDWKVLPMAAVIAALVSMGIRRDFFLTMEGNLKGAFALTCVAIWNGCFNSIQAVCRERPIIKREHRSGLHISSYVAAHMIYQLGLCLAQTVLTMYVLMMMGVSFPAPGFMTPWALFDVGITMLLVSYASDMLSLFISSMAHTTTGAMTVMPFVLIFQLVFSGGIIPLPAWAKPLSNFTISNYGICAVAAQSGYNEAPMVAVWKTLDGMRNEEVGGTFTVGQALDLLDSPAIESRRDTEVMRSFTVGEVADILSGAEESLHLRDIVVAQPVTLRAVGEFILNSDALKAVRELKIPLVDKTAGDLISYLLTEQSLQSTMDEPIGSNVTLGQVLDTLHVSELTEAASDVRLNEAVTLGDIVDFAKTNPAIQAQRDRSFTFKATVGELLDLFGEENVKTLVQQKTAAAAYQPSYERSEKNVINNWLTLGVFALGFALLSVIVLELIDRDKR